jgi:hypothetical protein
MGKRSAIVVGINEYEDGSFQNLKYADRDANAIVRVLSDPDIGDLARTTSFVFPENQRPK